MDNIFTGENYITIKGWMITDLKLSGNSLLIYAIIYGFSQDGESSFTGNLQYLADACNATKQGVQKNLKELIDNGLITKKEYFRNNLKYCEYRCEPCNKVAYHATKLHTMQQSCIPNDENLLIINNIYNKYNNINNTNNKNNNKDDVINVLENEYETHGYSKEDFLGSVKQKPKTKKKNLYENCVDEVSCYTQNIALHNALLQYLTFRLSVKDKPLYSVAQWRALLNKLNDFSKTDNLVAVVNQSLENGWCSFYPLKSTNQTTNTYREKTFGETENVKTEQVDVDIDELKESLKAEGKQVEF